MPGGHHHYLLMDEDTEARQVTNGGACTYTQHLPIPQAQIWLPPS